MKPSHHRLIPNWLLLICAIVLVAALGYITWLFVKEPSPTATPIASTNTNVNANTNTSNTNSATTADWKTYANTDYGFSIKYPKDLTYEVINNGKNIVFQTSDDKTKYDNCMKVDGVECIKSSQLAIGIDETVGTTSGDNISLTLDQIVQNRVSGSIFAKSPVKILLSSQPAYEGIDQGMFASYIITSKFNDHIYDIRLVQNCSNTPVAIETCKKEVTDIANTMLSTFQFTK